MSKTRREKGTWNKGKHLSEETKRKLSEANKGKTISEENKRKLIEANKGKHRSKEIRDKISKAQKGRPGRKQSEEIKRKISEKNKGLIPKNRKPVQDRYGRIFKSIKECSIEHNIPVTTLTRWIKEHPEKGFKFI